METENEYGRKRNYQSARSLPLPFVAVPRFAYPALFLLSSPLPCPLPFLPFSLSLCLSITLSVCRSVSLSLILSFSLPLCLLSLTAAFPRPSWLPSVSRFVSFPLSLSLFVFPSVILSFFPGTSVSLSFCLAVSLCLRLMSVYSFVPSALDPQTQGANKNLVRPVGSFLASLIGDSLGFAPL